MSDQFFSIGEDKDIRFGGGLGTEI